MFFQIGPLTTVSETGYTLRDFNNAGAPTNFSGHHVATSVVADAVTLLSNSWNDVNSFISPYTPGGRNATTTTYRFDVVAGKALSFPLPGACGGGGCYQDFGTDGGVHNFLRFLENWGGQSLDYRGSIRDCSRRQTNSETLEESLISPRAELRTEATGRAILLVNGFQEFFGLRPS